MKILFAMSSPEYLRFYDSTIQELAARGHHVVIAANAIREGKPVRFDVLDASSARVTVAGVLPERGDAWTLFARGVRGTMDFLRYLHPRLASAPLLRARLKRQGLPWTLQWLDRIRSLPPRVINALMRSLSAIERGIPVAPPLVRFLDDHTPDVVLVSPLVEPASDQVDLVRAAQARGTHVGTLVASWDNLTNKGDLRVQTDFVAVWNEAQKREAVEFHRVAPEHVAVTGAQPFDRWFERQPSCSREEFCARVGLPADKPFVLFTGSSIFIARAEVEMPFVRQWIDALRASSSPVTRGLAVLVRPHPYNGRAWNPDLFNDMADVAVWPRGGYDPVDEANRAGLFDSLFYCAAVVGINTSAMIEAAIVGRPVLSIETPQFAGTQDGTLHYQHLLPENGGFLRVASSLEEHVGQLAAVLQAPQAARAELDRFVDSFIRPHGRDRPATAVLTDAIERFGASPAPAAARDSVGLRVLRTSLRPLAAAGYVWLPPSERKKYRRSPAAGSAQGDSARAPRLTRVMLLALVAPALAATLALGTFVVAEVLGRTPLAYEAPHNIAEAAGMGMGAEVLRRLQGGEDPAAVYDVRADIISSSVRRATALEAAIWSRRVELVRMLDRRGAIEPATRRHLACLAADIRAVEISSYLAATGGTACTPGSATQLVEARSR